MCQVHLKTQLHENSQDENRIISMCVALPMVAMASRGNINIDMATLGNMIQIGFPFYTMLLKVAMASRCFINIYLKWPPLATQLRLFPFCIVSFCGNGKLR